MIYSGTYVQEISFLVFQTGDIYVRTTDLFSQALRCLTIFPSCSSASQSVFQSSHWRTNGPTELVRVYFLIP